MEKYGIVAVVDSLEEACAFPIMLPNIWKFRRENKRIIPLLTNYGSMFEGELAAEVFGDYVAGTNHALPTLRVAVIQAVFCRYIFEDLHQSKADPKRSCEYCECSRKDGQSGRITRPRKCRRDSLEAFKIGSA